MTTVWELSPLYRHTNTVVCEQELLTHHGNRIVLRRSDTLQVVRTWTLSRSTKQQQQQQQQQHGNERALHPISHNAHSIIRPNNTTNSKSLTPTNDDMPLTHLSMSQDTQLVLAYAASDRQCVVFDREHDESIAKVDIGLEGATNVTWSANGRAILAWSSSHLRVSIHDLTQPSPTLHIMFPKCTFPRGFSFSKDGNLLAILERHNARDHIGIYDCSTWKLVKHFPVGSPSVDSADLHWSPCTRYLAVEEVCTDFVVHIFTPDGRHLNTYEPYAKIGRGPTTEPVADSDLERTRLDRSTEGWVGLGVRTIAWQPTGEWIALGGYDGKAAWREPAEWTERTRGKGIVPFESVVLPHNLVAVRADPTKSNPKMGIAQLVWSPSGCWLAAINLMIHSNAVRSVVWQPINAQVNDEGTDDMQETLIIVSGQKGFTLWREPNPDDEQERIGFAECVGVPGQTEFGATHAKFDPEGKSLLLSDRDMFVVAYPVVE
ncbi:hypothetical protein OIO90_006159 [Microbotryomycetes sp. JL221]|nr:hypothetical protein OIO90_006159 [Microbotryomycetes sp. JL221]